MNKMNDLYKTAIIALCITGKLQDWQVMLIESELEQAPKPLGICDAMIYVKAAYKEVTKEDLDQL